MLPLGRCHFGPQEQDLNKLGRGTLDAATDIISRPNGYRQEDVLYRFPSNIDFSICRREIAASLNDFSNRWCKRENVEPDALKEWKINIFKIIDTRISFYSRNTHLLPPKPKSSFSHLKRGIQDFHMNYVLVPADKAANNVVVV